MQFLTTRILESLAFSFNVNMHSYRYLGLLTGLFVSVLLISGIVSTKIVAIGSLQFDGGTLLFPLSYIFGDILTEVYGYKKSRQVIWTGFGAMILMSAMIYIVGIMPSSPERLFQQDYANILLLAPRIFLASIVSYLIGEFTNSYILARLKVKTKGKYLFIRLIASTIAGEAIDTSLFVLIAFAGILSTPTLLIVALSNYIFKLLIEIVLYPVTKHIINTLKQQEQTDYFDSYTSFNPFSLK